MYRYKNKISWILPLLIVIFLLNGCGKDRAGNSTDTLTGKVKGIVDRDTDGDGISDEDEINRYGTDPLRADSDGDGLKDGLEIRTYDTNATNPDTDGDCLLDSFEVLNYETNATNRDTDGDGVADGIEIYSYGIDRNKTCLTSPETLLNGFNIRPAIDNIPNDGSDVINALDPNNHKDTDGDGLSNSDEVVYGTNPLLEDTDFDGLKDGEEIYTYDTNATNPDTDFDGLKDGEEIYTYDTNVTNSDTDEDGLKDGEEIHTYDTNATLPDTDFDGLKDGEEIYTYDTNATVSDTDGDGLKDGEEVYIYDTNATNPDTDGDGVDDGIEIYSYGTDINESCLSAPETIIIGFNITPAIDNISNDENDVINALDPNNHKDTDGDGLSNSDEVVYGTNPLLEDTDFDGLKDGEEIYTYDTNATVSDTDGDGLKDGEEVYIYDTNATNPDTDGDGLKDGEEIFTYDTNATSSDTDGDGLKDGEEIYTYDTNATNFDTDNDGLGDGLEINTHATDPKSDDTDGDGLKDGEEISQYLTDPKNEDSDGDTLKDGEEVYHSSEATNPLRQDSDNDGLFDSLEVLRDDLNATNPDTDGDCLLDSYELNFYHTDTNDTDTDKDGVEDGLEVYGDLNTVCIKTPETLMEGVNTQPAQDNLTIPDVIDALDPLNDSDRDRQANIKELECEEGDPKNILKLCSFITDSNEGASLVSAGFVYIPGGFDVDEDGILETGFWTSSYHARAKKDEIIERAIVNETVGRFNSYLQKKFFMINATDIISKTIHGYSNETLYDTLDNVPSSKVLEFSANISPSEKKRLSGVLPVIAMVGLSKYEVKDSEGKSLNLSLGLLTLKQYAQIQKLLEADKKNGGNGQTIHNALLGVDKNVPLLDYSTVVHEFGKGYKEFLSSIMQMKEGYVVMCAGCPWLKPWMGINKDILLKNPNETQANGSIIARGTDSKLDVGMGVGPTKDDYGVLVRAGELLDLTIGVMGGVSDAPGTHDGIGFRATSGYLK